MLRAALRRARPAAALGARAPARALAAPPPRARVVLNHSTHVPGLIASLEAGALAAGAAGVTTIVPGRLARTRGGAAEALALKVSVPVRGGFRVLARRGSMIQEVFVTTALGEEALQAVLDAMPRG